MLIVHVVVVLAAVGPAAVVLTAVDVAIAVVATIIASVTINASVTVGTATGCVGYRKSKKPNRYVVQKIRRHRLWASRARYAGEEILLGERIKRRKGTRTLIEYVPLG